MFYTLRPTPGKIVYGKLGNRNGAEVLEVWDVTPWGGAYLTGETIYTWSETGACEPQCTELRPEPLISYT